MVRSGDASTVARNRIVARPGRKPTRRGHGRAAPELTIGPGQTVYLVAPHGLVTGGPEAIHQLGAALCASGADARIVYARWTIVSRRLRDSLVAGGRAAAYAAYAVPEALDIEDVAGHVLVLPEIWSAAADEFEQIRTAVWWLSVDNNLASPLGKFFARRSRRRVAHLHQSAYAEAYLRRHGVAGSRHLGDYLNPSHGQDVLSPASIQATLGDRRPLVLFNPRKGMAVTRRLAERAEERGIAITWVPVADLSALEVSLLMRLAMVYVDFGNHPGMDRMPREAAVAGCCVVTGRRGAAGFAADVPIPDRFKFDDDATDEILDRIAECIEGYTEECRAFDPYRAFVADQARRFRADVAGIFGVG